MGSREELQERAVEGWEVFDGNTPHRPYVDAVKIDCAKCGARVSRIPDVGNPWLDAGIVAYSTTKFGSDRAYWERWVPADLILECFPGQFRNWFYALLAMSTMMDLKRREESGGERKPPFKNLLGHALVKDEHGRAMHKSDGTAIWFEEAAEQVGVDTMRWMYCAQPPTVDLKFGLRHPEEEVTVALPGGEMTHTVDGVQFCKVTSTPADEKRRKVLLTLWHSYAFFCEYARLDGFRPGVDVVAVAERPDIDRWVLSELQVLVGEVRGAFERFELNKACEQLERYVDVLSNWYIRRNRPRFWRSEAGRGDADKRAAYQTLYDALLTVTKLIAPVVPFLAETMYQNLGRAFDAGAPASVHHVEYPVVDEGLIDGELSASMNATIRLVGLGRAVRSQEKIGVRQPLRTMTVMPGDDAEAAAARRFAEQIKEELNVKELEVRQDAGLVSYELKANFKTLGPKFGKEVKAVVAALGKLDASAAAPKVQAGEALEVEVGGRTVQVEASDVKLFVQQPEGTASVQDGGTVVVLDTVITEELAQEGLARDVVRKLQDLRKTSGFAVEDRIQVRLATEDAALREAIEAHREWLSRQLLADTLEFTEVEGVEVVVRAQPKSVLRASLVKG